MLELLHNLGPVLSYLVTSGVILGAWRSLRGALAARKAGVSVRDGKRRLDLQAQRDSAISYIHSLREFCIAHGSAPADLPPLPLFLKDPA